MKNIHIIPTDKPSRLAKHSSGSFHIVSHIAHKKGLYKMTNQNIYITSDEEIKEGDWVYNIVSKTKFKATKQLINLINDTNVTLTTNKKIILATDQDLIKNNVQEISEEFIQWFVQNPSCEFVKVKPYCEKLTCQNKDCNVCCQELKYKIIIPQEEPKQETLSYTEAAKKDERIFNSTMMKQETLEEAAENLTTDQIAWRWLDIEENYNSIEDTISFVKGVEIGIKWQQEQDEDMYSEEDMIAFLDWSKSTNKEKSEYELRCLLHGKEIDSKKLFTIWVEQFKK
jgi:hypothetical protein